MSKLYAEERRALILEEIQRNSRVSVSYLARKLNVSKVTVRTDLKELEKHLLLKRTHGGAVTPDVTNELSFTNRLMQHRHEKEMISSEAMHLIQDHDSLLLDASSTCLTLARMLKQTSLQLTILTTGLYAAQELVENPQINVFVLGGQLKNQNSIEGLAGISILNHISVNKFFFSARALTPEGQLMDFDIHEVELKRILFEKTAVHICLLDSSKFTARSVGEFATIRDVNMLITDQIPRESMHLSTITQVIDLSIHNKSKEPI